MMIEAASQRIPIYAKKGTPEASTDNNKAFFRNLVRKARDKDGEAFVELMEHMKLSMYRIAKSILYSDEDVADAMSDTVLTAWEKLEELKKAEAFKSWLFRILINHCYDQLRKRETLFEEGIVPDIAWAEESYQDVEWRETLEALEEPYRLPLILFYLEGMSLKEIGKALGLSESAVGTRLVRGRKCLAAIMNGKSL